MAQTFVTKKEGVITALLTAAATTIKADFDSGITAGRLQIKESDTRFEFVSYTGTSTASGITTYTGLTRGLSQTADPATAGTGLEFVAGTKVRVIAMHDQLVDKSQPTTFLDNITVLNELVPGIQLQSLTTAERDATTPVNGHIIYNETTAEGNIFQGGVWTAIDSPAGADDKAKVSATDTTTGFLDEKVTAGDGLSKAIVGGGGNETLDFDVDTTDTTTFVKTSSGAGDEDKVPVLDASGQLADGFVDFTSASVPTVKITGQTFSGVSTGDPVFKGPFDSDFLQSKSTTGDPVGVYDGTDIVVHGRVTGLSGLTAGRTYYLDSTNGGLSLTADTDQNIGIGYALSATELWVNIFPNAGFDFGTGGIPLDFLASWLMDGDGNDQTSNFDFTTETSIAYVAGDGTQSQVASFTRETSFFSRTPFNALTNYTVVFWFNTSFSGDFNALFVTDNAQLVVINAAGNVEFDNGPNTITSAGTENDGTWHFCVATQSSGTTELFIDNVSEGTAGSANSADFSPLWFGSLAGVLNDGYSGKMAGAKIYNRVLSSVELTNLFNAGTILYV